MIEFVLTLMYVGLSGLILYRWRQGKFEESRPGVKGKYCETVHTHDVRIGRIRCMLRSRAERLFRATRERGQR